MPFWVGGTGNYTDAAAHWAAISGGAPGAGNLPNSGADAIFDANSGAGSYTVTVDATSACRDFDASASAGTMTLAGAAGLSCFRNFALKSGMTWSFSSTLFMAATSGVNTVTTAGVVMGGGIQVTGIGGTWQQADALTITGNNFDFRAGTWNTQGFSMTAPSFLIDGQATTRTFNCTNSTLTATSANGGFSMAIPTGLTLVLTGSTLVTTAINNAGVSLGTYTYHNLTVAPTTGKGAIITASGNPTFTGTLKTLGNAPGASTGSVLVRSSVRGTQRTFTVAVLDASSDFVDFADINFAGAAAPFAVGTRIGDCDGNAGIVTTTPAPQTSNGNTTLTYSSAARWNGAPARVPLPQDDVSITSGFAAGQTILFDMPRLGRNITIAPAAGAPAVNLNVSTTTGGYLYYGNFTFGGSLGVFTAIIPLVYSGRRASTLTTFGRTLGANPSVDCSPAGTLTLGDALVTNDTGGNNFNHATGTFNDGGFSVTLGGTSSARYNNSGGTLIRSGAWTTNMSAAAAPSFWLVAGGTIVDSGSHKLISSSSSGNYNFTGGGQTYKSLWFAPAGAAVTLQIAGANFFDTLKLDPNRNLQLTAATTTTSRLWDLGLGCTLGSITAANHTVAKSGGGTVGLDGVTVSRSIAPASTFYAGGASVNGGNNTGWIFGYAPTAPTRAAAMIGVASGPAPMAGVVANPTGYTGVTSQPTGMIGVAQ